MEAQVTKVSAADMETGRVPKDAFLKVAQGDKVRAVELSRERELPRSGSFDLFLLLTYSNSERVQVRAWHLKHPQRFAGSSTRRWHWWFKTTVFP